VKLLVITSETNVSKNQLALMAKLWSKKFLLMVAAPSGNVHTLQPVSNLFQILKPNALNTLLQFVVKAKNSFEPMKNASINLKMVLEFVVVNDTRVSVTKLYASNIHQSAHQVKLTKSPDELANVALLTLLSALNFHVSKNVMPSPLATTLVLS
jgi:hypothetical protein